MNSVSIGKNQKSVNRFTVYLVLKTADQINQKPFLINGSHDINLVKNVEIEHLTYKNSKRKNFRFENRFLPKNSVCLVTFSSYDYPD